VNLRVIIGLLLLAPVLAAVFFGPVLAPYPKGYSEAVRYEETENGRELAAPPSAPSSEHLLGTNKGGRDILSLILFGARWTVGITFTIAALKVLLGGIIGVSAIFRRKQKHKNLKAVPLNALPQMVFLFFVLSTISINFPFNKMILITIFGIIVLIFGTPANAAAIEAACREQTLKEYYTAARTSGAGNAYLVLHHIFPFITERLLSLFLGEMISVLNTIGQMGIFGVFIGGTIKTFDPVILNSRLHEWSGLVGQARFYIYSEQWILFGPLAAYVMFLLSLYLIHEGVKHGFRQTFRQ